MYELLYCDDLCDRDALAAWLRQRRLSPEACQRKAALLASARQALPRPGALTSSAPLAFFVPGRIEVLGKHTDYAGGSSIVVAIERGLCVVAQPRHDAQVVITDAVSGQRAEFTLSPDLHPCDAEWPSYPMAVARRLVRNFRNVHRGTDIALAGDLPHAAGLSSSSALVAAMFSVLAEINALRLRDAWLENITHATDLPSYLAAIENGRGFRSLAGDAGVGTMGGSQDHTAILLARPGTLLQYRYCPLRLQFALRMPAGHSFVVAFSGVSARKIGNASDLFNRTSRLTSAILEIWRNHTGRIDGNLADALASAPDAASRLRCLLASHSHPAFAPEDLLNRLDHFLTEYDEIIPAADAALAAGDLEAFGRVVDRSQEAAERLLGNQVAETSFLAASARKLGAVAASAFGAGFGGSVWAMVDTSSSDVFLDHWSTAYHREFPQHREVSTFFTTAAGPGMFRVC